MNFFSLLYGFYNTTYEINKSSCCHFSCCTRTRHKYFQFYDKILEELICSFIDELNKLIVLLLQVLLSCSLVLIMTWQILKFLYSSNLCLYFLQIKKSTHVHKGLWYPKKYKDIQYKHEFATKIYDAKSNAEIFLKKRKHWSK